MKSTDRIEIDSADITERLVGITPTYLNNFVQRGTFGLRASVQAGELRAKRRLFSKEDVFGIALVWLLFEAGFRTDPIIRILKDIARTKQANANLAAEKLQDGSTNWLAIVRSPRGPSKKIPDRPEQAVVLSREADLTGVVQHPAACLTFIPVGSKFQDIKKRLDVLF